jgi:hypothetical protein
MLMTQLPPETDVEYEDGSEPGTSDAGKILSVQQIVVEEPGNNRSYCSIGWHALKQMCSRCANIIYTIHKKIDVINEFQKSNLSVDGEIILTQP